MALTINFVVGARRDGGGRRAPGALREDLVRRRRRLVDAVAAGEDMDAYLVREGPGRPRREKKRWVPVAKKKKPPAAAGSPRPPPEADGKN